MSEKEISEHNLVPGHRILKKEEYEKILKELTVTREQLPKILNVDPAIELIHAKVGDIIEITRKSPTAGTTKYYRIVIAE